MSKLKLINILKNKILEQAPIGFYDTDEEPGVYYASNLETGDIKKIDVNSIESDFYDENETYQEDSLLTYSAESEKEKNEGIINPNLISDIIKALRIANVSAQISYSRGNHGKYTNSGNISRHWAGNAVDLSIINGQGNSAGNSSNKGIGNAQFMKDGDKIVAALEKIGYKFGEGGNVKGYLWRTDVGGNHWHHVHVSNTDRGTKTKKDEDTDKKLESKRIEKPSYIISLNNPSTKKIALIWGGTPSSTFGAKFMESQGKDFLNNKNVIYSNWENSLDQIEKILKENKLSDYKINSISGFSKGAEKTWDYINSGYDFIGLIDPSTPKSFDSLPNNVKMISNSGNWVSYPKMKKNIKKLEDSGQSKRIGNDLTYNHTEIPKLFFKEYSSEI